MSQSQISEYITLRIHNHSCLPASLEQIKQDLLNVGAIDYEWEEGFNAFVEGRKKYFHIRVGIDVLFDTDVEGLPWTSSIVILNETSQRP